MAVRSSVNRAKGMWFRDDLRLDDNIVLQAAASGATSLLPVYVFDPRNFNVPTLAGARKSAARRARFLLESVACLRKNLEAKGSGLAVAVGRPEDSVPKLCSGFEAVCIQQGVCSEEQMQEKKVEKHLKAAKTDLNRIWGGTLYMPEECGCAPKGIPLLFTAFKNKAESKGRIRDPIDAPKKLPPLPELDEAATEALTYMPSLQDLGYPAE